jgi:hypothetical protein
MAIIQRFFPTTSGSFAGNGSGLTNVTATTALTATSASYALTASYAMNGGGGGGSINTGSFATTGSNTFIGTQTVTGSIIATGEVIGSSFQGTASQAISASYASTASYALQAVSASFASTASKVTITNDTDNYILTANGNGTLNGESLLTFDGAKLSLLYQSGDEGGEILLNKPVTNTTLTGSGITIDSYQNKIRFFEQGGAARGAYIDLTACAGGAGTNLLSGVGGATFSGGGATFNGGTNVNNRIVTATETSPELNGEANLTFDGSTLAVTGSLITSQNVSIGTTLTTSPLTVISTSSPLITIQSTTANSYSNMRFSGTERNYTIGVGNASETTFGVANKFFVYDDTAGAMRMTVDSSGNVGIGTTSPGSLLHVAGAISGSSITTTTNGYGISGSPNGVALTSTQVFATATTSINAATYIDITGCSVSLAAGKWLITGTVIGAATNLIIQCFLAIRDGSNNVVAASAMSRPAAGTAGLNAPIGTSWSAIVTPAVTTTYKLSAARGLTTHTSTWTVYDGTGYNTTSHATDNSDKGTNILAIRIA